MCSLGTSVDPPIKDRVPIIDHEENEKGLLGTSNCFADSFGQFTSTNFIHSAGLLPLNHPSCTALMFNGAPGRRVWVSRLLISLLSRYLSTLSASTFNGSGFLLKNVG